MEEQSEGAMSLGHWTGALNRFVFECPDLSARQNRYE